MGELIRYIIFASGNLGVATAPCCRLPPSPRLRMMHYSLGRWAQAPCPTLSWTPTRTYIKLGKDSNARDLITSGTEWGRWVCVGGRWRMRWGVSESPSNPQEGSPTLEKDKRKFFYSTTHTNTACPRHPHPRRLQAGTENSRAALSVGATQPRRKGAAVKRARAGGVSSTVGPQREEGAHPGDTGQSLPSGRTQSTRPFGRSARSAPPGLMVGPQGPAPPSAPSPAHTTPPGPAPWLGVT